MIYKLSIEILESRKSNLDYAYEKYIIKGNAGVDSEAAIDNRTIVENLNQSILLLQNAEDIIKILGLINKELYSKFGSESYEIRCKIHDLKDKIKNTSE